MRHDRHQRATFYFDGGCRPNPGPMHAAVVSRGVAHFRDDLGDGDNNEAEWLALLFAVDVAKQQRAAEVLLIGDSAMVVAQASGRQPCRSPHLHAYLAAYQDAVAPFLRVHVRQVPRSRNLAGIALAQRDLP